MTKKTPPAQQILDMGSKECMVCMGRKVKPTINYMEGFVDWGSPLGPCPVCQTNDPDYHLWRDYRPGKPLKPDNDFLGGL